MAILCGVTTVPVTDENDSWYVRETRYGYTARIKKATTKRKFSRWTQQSKFTFHLTRESFNQSLLAYICHRWASDPTINVADYNLYAPSNSFHRADGTLKTPNGFQLFVWQNFAAAKWAALFYEYHHDTPVYYLTQKDIPSTWAENGTPSITSASWSASGDITVTWSPSFSESGFSPVISVIPPDFSPTDFTGAIDVGIDQAYTVPPVTTTVPHAMWSAQLLNVNAGDTWGLALRQALPGGGNKTPSNFTTTSVTIGT